MVEAVALVLAVVLVPLTGGSFRRLARLRVVSAWLLFVGLAIQVGLEVVHVPHARMDDVGFALLMASYVLVLAFALLNLRVTGMVIVTVGIALNTLVIALNQGMPYRAPASTSFETTVKHRPERPNDVLKVLDDRIIVPGPLGESISFGDLILAVGIVDVVVRASRSPRRRREQRDAKPGEPPGPSTVPPIPTRSRHLDLVRAEQVDAGPPAPQPAPRGNQPRWPLRAPWWSRHPTLTRLHRPPPPEAVTIDLSAYDLPPESYGNLRRALRGDVDRSGPLEHPLERAEHPRVVDVTGP